MELKAGDRVEVESESTERPPRKGVIKEVVQGAPSPRYCQGRLKSGPPMPDEKWTTLSLLEARAGSPRSRARRAGRSR